MSDLNETEREELQKYRNIFMFSGLFAQTGCDLLAKKIENDQLLNVSQFDKDCLSAVIVDYNRVAYEYDQLKKFVAEMTETLKTAEDTSVIKFVAQKMFERVDDQWEQVQIPCPDGKPDCEVYHCEFRRKTNG